MSRKSVRKGKVSLRLNSSDGFSLVNILVAVGISGVMAAAMASIFGNGFAARKNLDLAIEKQAIAASILRGASCQDTLPAGSCAPGVFYAVNRANKDGTITKIVANAAPLTSLGGFTLRAECNSAGDGLILRAARLRAGASLTSTTAADFIPDPLTKQAVTWADDRSLLFGVGVPLCSPATSNWSNVDQDSTADFNDNCQYRVKWTASGWDYYPGAGAWMYAMTVHATTLVLDTSPGAGVYNLIRSTQKHTLYTNTTPQTIQIALIQRNCNNM